jgi:hypothetical protein
MQALGARIDLQSLEAISTFAFLDDVLAAALWADEIGCGAGVDMRSRTLADKQVC